MLDNIRFVQHSLPINFRGNTMVKSTICGLALAGGIIGALAGATATFAQDACASGKTITNGVLTIATGNPAYYPWVMDDAPASGQGFEAAVAYAVADRMGFEKDAVTWVRTTFDQAIQPGVKDFDFNIQQFSITADREKIVDFSAPYYSAAMAILVRQTAIDNGAMAEYGSLKTLKWGGVAGHTSVPMIMQSIKPSSDMLMYDDNANVVEAMKSNQIDAALFDLPTALYLSAVVLDDGAVLGQFPASNDDNPDQFGLLMQYGSALKACVDAAVNSLSTDGTLAAIEAEWMQEATGVPVVK
jgi:polar amino acid transport system substrate-binding protein